ncbi:MAG: hypothetical protein ACOYXM_17740 [Actinomycetota bacterium]
MLKGNVGKAGRSDALGLIGWVFADMLLALVLVFMGTQPGDPTAGAATPTTTTTTAPPATTTTSTPRGVEKGYICIRVQTDPRQLGTATAPGPEVYLARLADELRGSLKAAGVDTREAGVVLSFGVGTTSGGRATADAYNALVLARVPEVFGGAATRGFWDGNPGAFQLGSVMLNIYPFADSTHPPQPVESSGAKC